MYPVNKCWLALAAMGFLAVVCLGAEDVQHGIRVNEALGLTPDGRGLCIVLGCGWEGAPDLLNLVASQSQMLVHGLAVDDAALARARKAIEANGHCGQVAVEKATFAPLPYLRDLANLTIVDNFSGLAKLGLTMDELLRVTAPHGAVCLLRNGQWIKQIKARPQEMDDWPHPAHGPDSNRVSSDRVIGFPVGLRWQDGIPMNFDRFHGGARAVVVSSKYCFSLSTTDYANLSPVPCGLRSPEHGKPAGKYKREEYLTARDAFNGLPLWKVNCETVRDDPELGMDYHNTAPLVTDGKRVYVYIKDHLAALDAATGQVRQTFPVRYPPVHLLLNDGLLVYCGWEKKGYAKAGPWAAECIQTKNGVVEAFETSGGGRKWSLPLPIQQMLWADNCLYLLIQSPPPVKSQELIAVDPQTGKERWHVAHTAISSEPDLALTMAGCGVVSVERSKAKKVSILSAATGKPLWESTSVGGSYWTPLVGGELWFINGRYDPQQGTKLGQLRFNLPAPICVAGCVVAGRYIMASRVGQYTDLQAPQGTNPRLQYAGVRGACLEGMVPANGMFYNAQNFCRCAPGQVPGFLAMGPVGAQPGKSEFEQPRLLEKGPAYDAIKPRTPSESDWPTFLHDAARSGCVSSEVPAEMRVLWSARIAFPDRSPLAEVWKDRLAGCITAPVVAEGLVFVAAIDEQRLLALDAVTGRPTWTAVLGSRIDSPPTIHRGMCLVGCHDGWVYALRAQDGQLAWRVRAAPLERRMVAFGQVESVWPVIGTITVQENVAYASAGRTSECDGGLAVLALDVATGKQLWARHIETGLERQNDVLALRDGKLVLHHMCIDPKAGAGAIPPKVRDAQIGLEGLLDSTWTALGTRRSGRLRVGKLLVEIAAWDSGRLFASDAWGMCYAITREAADRAAKPYPEAKDLLWRQILPNTQLQAMALCTHALVTAGTSVLSSQEATGVLRVLSPQTGKLLAEYRLDDRPICKGLAVAGGRVYVALQNGCVVCLGKPP